MKVRVAYTVEVDEFVRRAIWWRTNDPTYMNPKTCPKATRKEVATYFEILGTIDRDDAVYTYQLAIEKYERGEEENDHATTA